MACDRVGAGAVYGHPVEDDAVSRLGFPGDDTMLQVGVRLDVRDLLIPSTPCRRI